VDTLPRHIIIPWTVNVFTIAELTRGTGGVVISTRISALA